jgi:hypothetical protein
MINEKKLQEMLFIKDKNNKQIQLTTFGILFFTLIGFRYLINYIGRKYENISKSK